MKITVQPLSYQTKLDDRQSEDIELIVIHCTELPDLTTAREYGEKIHYASGTGNSGHFYIDRNGRVYQWVNPAKISHHVKGHNQKSIGIELVNKGRFPHWHHSDHQTLKEPYPDVLIASLIKLINQLHQQIPSLKHIAGHEDLDQDLITSSNNPKLKVRRKVDPGPLFPWQQVMHNIPLINIGSNARKYE